jgi:hypothetical protein
MVAGDLHTSFTFPTKSPETATLTSILAVVFGAIVRVVEETVPVKAITFI